MEALSVREYRNNLASSFDKAVQGKQVLIRRKNEIFALVRIGREDLMITPKLQQRIDEVRKTCQEGNCVTCATPKEIDQYLDSL